ncbi:MAG: stage V sporulation protein AD [Gemmiger sp.]
MAIRRGDTVIFPHPPVIAAWAAVGGKKESEGPLAASFDELVQDASFASQGCKSWEQGESLLQERCARRCLDKAGITPEEVELAFAGDLQAQCTASNYTMRTLNIPFAGLYGACSTMTEGLCLGAMAAAAGYARQVLAMSSSHFCAAEREFRTPLEYGGKRTTTAQWTATAAGACLLRPSGSGVPVLSATIGRVCDPQVMDINNMGAAMAPAAAATLLAYFSGTGTQPENFDAIFTGDLGQVGSELLHEMMESARHPIPNHRDCGCLIYDVEGQNVQSGGSGAGCSAAVLAAYVLPKLMSGEYRRVLFLSTGALMSQTTFLQGESIPGIAHCIELGSPEGGNGK